MTHSSTQQLYTAVQQRSSSFCLELLSSLSLGTRLQQHSAQRLTLDVREPLLSSSTAAPRTHAPPHGSAPVHRTPYTPTPLSLFCRTHLLLADLSYVHAVPTPGTESPKAAAEKSLSMGRQD
uniref:Uncharacterized protein n=1 Tax=Knipowitschia caucasica TaxID=637954 RepID=A0AAV2JV87_KNICA